MPAGVDEQKWTKARNLADESKTAPEKGSDGYYAYVMSIYKNILSGEDMAKRAAKKG